MDYHRFRIVAAYLLIAGFAHAQIVSQIGVNYESIPVEHHPAIERALDYYEALGYEFEFAACDEDNTVCFHWEPQSYYARSLFTHPEPWKDDIILSSRYELGHYLVTVIMHELGHILGIWEHGDELMAPFPAMGSRLTLRDQRRLRGVHRFAPSASSGAWR